MKSTKIPAKICVSIAEKTVEECLASMAGLELAEIRLDALEPVHLTPENLRRIFSAPPKLIATCRPGRIDEQRRLQVLQGAITAGAAMVDVEVESADSFKDEVVQMARLRGCKIIVSFHDPRHTPSSAELEHVVRWCFDAGADIAKVACTVQEPRDNVRLLGLLDSGKPVVVVGMGPKGRAVRLLAPLLGSPFTFAARRSGKETAPGQMSVQETSERMRRIAAEAGLPEAGL